MEYGLALIAFVDISPRDRADNSINSDPLGLLKCPHGGFGFLRGHQGGGSVHHIAFRAADDAEQGQMAQKLVANHGLHPTEQRDRNYFRSIYFREPGGVLFEIATDIPGFAVDEPVATLGRDLKLPSFLEAQRKQIENVLPSLEESAS